jgi:hypothetical protein
MKLDAQDIISPYRRWKNKIIVAGFEKNVC